MTLRKLDTDFALIALIGLAHGLSHFFQLALPPLFPILTESLGTSYAVLGGALAIFFTVSGIAQTAAGFLVDRLGARKLLLCGVALLSASSLMFAAVPNVAMLYAAAVVGGLGNSVFHPADLALLNGRVTPRRLGHAFSMHGLGGSLGWVLAPICVAPLAHAFGWRVAVATAGVIGLVALVFFASQAALKSPAAPRPRPRTLGHDMRLLASQPVLLCFLFFALYAIGMMGFQTFAAAASAQIYDVSLLIASGALTAFLIGNTFGVLAGGAFASRSNRHGVIVGVAMSIAAVLAAILAGRLVPLALLLPAMVMLGFAIGSVGPSRDIIIGAVAPKHSRGKVYGFVYSGLDVGGFVGPVIYGMILDRNLGIWVFGIAAVFLALSIPTLLGSRPGAAAQLTELKDA